MNGRIVLIIVLLLALVAGGFWLLGGPASYPITNAQPTGSTVVALGDSLTAGVGAPEAQAYPAILSRRLGVEVLNAGVSGDTTAQALSRLERDVLARDPCIVLVLLGGNDVLRKLDQDAAFANLEAIIERIQARGALVVLMGVRIPMADSWHRRYEELARRTGCPFVPDVMDGIWGQRDLMADSIHPNAAGYAVMAEKIESVVRPYLGAGVEESSSALSY